METGTTDSRDRVHAISAGAERDRFRGQAKIDAEAVRPNNKVDPEILERTRSLSRQIIRTTIGADKGLKAQGEDSIIDANFSRVRQTEDIPELSRDEAINRCGVNLMEIDSIGLSHLPPEWNLIRGNQVALGVYLVELGKAERGEDLMPYDEYLEAEAGFKPRLIPPEDIDKNLETSKELLANLGIRFNPDNDEKFIRAVRQHSEEQLLENTDEVELEFWEVDRRNRVKLSKVLGGVDLSKVDFVLSWEEAGLEEFWWMFEGFDPNILRANSSKYWDLGWIEVLAGHEPAHYFQEFLMEKSIRAGEVDPAAGLHIIPGPGFYQWEGLAQTVTDFAAYDVTAKGRLARELYRMEKRALHNGLARLELDDLDIKEVSESLRVYMPRMGLRDIQRLLKRGIESPFERALLPTYGRADYELMQLQKRFGEQSAHFLLGWLSKPKTREQMMITDVEPLVYDEES